MNKIHKIIHAIQPPALSTWWTAVLIALLLCLFGMSSKAQPQSNSINTQILTNVR